MPIREPTYQECINEAAKFLRGMPKVSVGQIESTQKHVEQWLALAAELRKADKLETKKFKAIKKALEKENAM